MQSLALLLCLVMGGSDDSFGEWIGVPNTTLTELPSDVGQKLTPDELKKYAQTSLPYKELTIGTRLKNGDVWLGTSKGLIYLPFGNEPRRLFHSRRWLPDNHVQDLAVDRDGAVWVKTSQGIGKLSTVETTLQQKMDNIHAMLRRYHLREGFVASVYPNTPGQVEEGFTTHSDDNDGLWTSLYVAAECYRFGATGDPQARKNAWESLKALMFLEKVTGISGFAARSVWPTGGDEPAKLFGGEWHRAKDSRWWWKGDTSSDEVDGHYYAYALYYDLVADEAQKKEIRAVVSRITDHILDHGYYYVGPSGKPTTWGVWDPKKLNEDPDWIEERGLNSLELLSHLKVAEHITGNAKYTKVYRELIDDHKYHINTLQQKILWPPAYNNHSDDELAFLVYFPLLWLERDPGLRKVYLKSLERSWTVERPEVSPFFNYIYAACRQASSWIEEDKRPAEAYVKPEDYDAALCEKWFRDVPADLYDWSVVNSDRADVVQPPAFLRIHRPISVEVLPIMERPFMRWNGNPYYLDDRGGARTRDDGSFILLPYWMGRYHRFID